MQRRSRPPSVSALSQFSAPSDRPTLCICVPFKKAKAAFHSVEVYEGQILGFQGNIIPGLKGHDQAGDCQGIITQVVLKPTRDCDLVRAFWRAFRDQAKEVEIYVAWQHFPLNMDCDA